MEKLGLMKTMTTRIKLWLLSISVLFETTVLIRGKLSPRHFIPSVEWTITNGLLIGLSFLPVLLVLRHGTGWPLTFAGLLAVFSGMYVAAQIGIFVQP
jgi:hypothetical protein